MSAVSKALVQQVQTVPGFRGVFYLVDRASGKAKSLTLWADEQAMWASEDLAHRIREEAAEREGQRVVSVERFEVGFSHLEP